MASRQVLSVQTSMGIAEFASVLAILVPFAWVPACAGPAPAPLAEPPKEEAMIVPNPPGATAVDEPVEVASFDLARDNVEVPLAVAAGPAGALAVAWVEGTKRNFSVVVARREEDKWLRAELGKAASGYPPRPRLAYSQNGDLVAAWDGRWDLPGGGFARWSAATRAWTAAAPFDDACRGEVWLCGDEAAFVRQVSRLNIGGIFSHEGTRKRIDKVCIAVLGEGGWDVKRTFEESNDLNCRSPALSPRFVAYIRKRSDRGEEVVIRERKQPDAESVLGAASSPAGVALGETGSEVVMCFGASDGVHAALYVAGRWTKAELAIPATRLLSCGVATAPTSALIWAVDRSGSRIRLARLREGRWTSPENIARGEGAAIAIAPDGTSGMLAWAEGWSLGGGAATAKRVLRVRALPLK